MLITKELMVKWNPTTRKYYEDLGHEYTKHNDEFLIPIEHLHHGSNTYIEFQCDECNEIESRIYRDYVLLKNKYNKDICGICLNKLNMKNRSSKAKTKEDFGYYTNHENRKYELDKYLKKYNELSNMINNTEGKRLYDNFHSHKDDIYDTAIELGYKIEDICKSLPKNYYIKYPEILKEKLLISIEENKRFPKSKEIEKILHVSNKFISNFGGINEFKKLLGYDDSKDLIDLRGDYNKSLGELICANYFCSQGLKDKYKREQYPFSKENRYFRSDFTFYLENNKELHIEVWGFKKSEISSERAKEYHKVRSIKENLYQKYSNDIILIGIDYEIFDLKYDEIQKYLYSLISPYINLKFKDVSYKKLLSPSLISDDEIFNGIMEISSDGKTFPTTIELCSYNSCLYSQILKRGYSYNEFANKYSVKTKLDKKYWTKKLVFEHFSNILNEGKFINKQSLNEEYNGLSEATEKFGYMTKLKLEYFIKLNEIPNQELDWVINLANNTTKTTSNFSKTEVNNAKKLLDKLYINVENNICCKTCGKEFTQYHIYELHCQECISNSNGKSKYAKPLYTETEYNNNFIIKAIKPYLLTSKGFNSVSDIKIQSYRNYFNMKWIDIIKKYNRFDDLYGYIIDEFKNYCKIDTKNKDIHRFANNHDYITYDILTGIGLDKIYRDMGIVKQRYTEEDYKINFLNIVENLGYIPMYKEFIDNTKINIVSYSNKFNIHKNIYDEIVKMYSSESDYEDYMKRKKEHKSNIGKATGKLARILSDEYLQKEFTDTFDNYFALHNKYPSSKVFSSVSNHDSSVYRKRYKKSWSEICEMYGYCSS